MSDRVKFALCAIAFVAILAFQAIIAMHIG